MANYRLRLILAGTVTPLALGGLIYAKTWSSRAVAAQNEVASKQALPIISAADPKVKDALHSQDIEVLRTHIGKQCAFEGTVAGIYTVPSNETTILNFSLVPGRAAAAFIKHDNYAHFPDVRNLVGLNVLVSGVLIEHVSKEGKSVLEVELSDPSQIHLIQ